MAFTVGRRDISSPVFLPEIQHDSVALTPPSQPLAEQNDTKEAEHCSSALDQAPMDARCQGQVLSLSLQQYLTQKGFDSVENESEGHLFSKEDLHRTVESLKKAAQRLFSKEELDKSLLGLVLLKNNRELLAFLLQTHPFSQEDLHNALLDLASNGQMWAVVVFLENGVVLSPDEWGQAIVNFSRDYSFSGLGGAGIEVYRQDIKKFEQGIEALLLLSNDHLSKEYRGQAVVEAAKRGRRAEEGIKILLGSGVISQEHRGQAIVGVAKRGDMALEVIEILLANRAIISSERRGQAVVQAAAHNGFRGFEVIKILLNSGDVSPEHRGQAVVEAAEHHRNYLAVISALLIRDISEEHRAQALMRCLGRDGYLEAMRFLLDNGISEDHRKEVIVEAARLLESTAIERLIADSVPETDLTAAFAAATEAIEGYAADVAEGNGIDFEHDARDTLSVLVGKAGGVAALSAENRGKVLIGALHSDHLVLLNALLESDGEIAREDHNRAVEMLIGLGQIRNVWQLTGSGFNWGQRLWCCARASINYVLSWSN